MGISSAASTRASGWGGRRRGGRLHAVQRGGVGEFGGDATASRRRPHRRAWAPPTEGGGQPQAFRCSQMGPSQMGGSGTTANHFEQAGRRKSAISAPTCAPYWCETPTMPAPRWWWRMYETVAWSMLTAPACGRKKGRRVSSGRREAERSASRGGTGPHEYKGGLQSPSNCVKPRAPRSCSKFSTFSHDRSSSVSISEPW